MVLKMDGVEALPPMRIQILGALWLHLVGTSIFNQVSLRAYHLSSRLVSPHGHIPGQPTRERLAGNYELK